MNTKNARVHREPLPANLAEALLNVPCEDGQGRSIGERLSRARAELKAAVAAANDELAGNPLAEILAEHASRLAGRRGSPSIVVDEDGQVMLEVSYASSKPAPETPPASRRKSDLPPITELRHEAKRLGIDPEPFGKGKINLMKAIEDAKAGATPTPEPEAAPTPEPAPAPAPAPARQKRTKTAPAITPPTVIHLEDEDEDLSALFGGGKRGAPEPTPEVTPEVAPEEPQNVPLPKRPTPARKMPSPSLATNASPPKLGGRSLSAIAAGAESEVDIDAILAQPAPDPSTYNDD